MGFTVSTVSVVGGFRIPPTAGTIPNDAPVWSTAAVLDDVSSGDAVSVTFVATDPEEGAVTYTVASGTLPDGLTLTGDTLSGTAPALEANTDYTFTIRATDDADNFTDREFSLTVLAPPADFLHGDAVSVMRYTGNGTAQTITGADFAPQMVIITKLGTGNNATFVFDNKRGVGKMIQFSSNNAELTRATSLTAFTATGFNLGADVLTNETGVEYIAYCLKNDHAFLYTGTGSAISRAHGKAGTPLSILTKYLTATGWGGYHSALGNGMSFSIQSTAVPSGPHISYWNNTTPSATHFSTGTNTVTNVNGVPYASFHFWNTEGVDVGAVDGGTGRLATTGRAKMLMLRATGSGTGAGGYIFNDLEGYDKHSKLYNTAGPYDDSSLITNVTDTYVEVNLAAFPAGTILGWAFH